MAAFRRLTRSASVGKTDPRYLLPDAQFRYERTAGAAVARRRLHRDRVSRLRREHPTLGEAGRGILDFDDLGERGRAGTAIQMTLMSIASRRSPPAFARDGSCCSSTRGDRRSRAVRRPARRSTPASRRCVSGSGFLDTACCPHDAGPPVCWCRKPIPGTVMDFAIRRDVEPARSLVDGVLGGRSADGGADRCRDSSHPPEPCHPEERSAGFALRRMRKREIGLNPFLLLAV